MPIFEVDNLHLHYLTRFGDKIPAVAGVSFAMEQGEVLGIAGESGCGKSTLVNGCMGLFIPPLWPTSGDVRVAGESIMGRSPKDVPIDRSGAPMPNETTVFSAKTLTCVFGHGKKSVTAIDDLTFTVAEEEIVSLVGGSGCGKSVLAKIMLNRIRPTRGGWKIDVDGHTAVGLLSRLPAVPPQPAANSPGHAIEDKDSLFVRCIGTISSDCSALRQSFILLPIHFLHPWRRTCAEKSVK